MSKNTEKKPRLRFPEFIDDWETYKISDIFKITRGIVLSTSEIEEKYIDKMPYPVYSSQTKNNGLLGYYKDYLYEDAITWTTDGANAGTVNYRVGKFYCTNVCGVLLSNKVKCSQMIAESLNMVTKKYVSYVGNPKLMNNVMSNIEISIPFSQEEQLKISKFFSLLDSFFILNQQNLEILQNIKKGFLQKLFPKKGETSPEFRFPGFINDWEQHKVGELLVERNERARTSKEYPLMAFIANKGVAPKGERYDRSSLVKDARNKLYKKTEIGDFIYSSNNLETGSIGLNKYGKACISPVYSIFKPTKIVDSDFLGRRLTRKDFINAMVKWRQGVVYGQWKIHESDFLKIKLLAPSLKEQRKIGAYLDFLDSLISLYLQKLEILQNIKKGLLQQMFV